MTTFKISKTLTFKTSNFCLLCKNLCSPKMVEKGDNLLVFTIIIKITRHFHFFFFYLFVDVYFKSKIDQMGADFLAQYTVFIFSKILTLLHECQGQFGSGLAMYRLYWFYSLNLKFYNLLCMLCEHWHIQCGLSVNKTTGPSCSKLTMSLINDSLKFTLSDTQIC